MSRDLAVRDGASAEARHILHRTGHGHRLGWALLAGALLAVVLAGTGLALAPRLDRSGGTHTAQEFVTRLQAGDGRAAFDLLAPRIRRNTTLEDFDGWVSVLSGELAGSCRRISGAELAGSGSQAQAKVAFTCPASSFAELDILLEKDPAGAWVVAYVDPGL